MSFAQQNIVFQKNDAMVVRDSDYYRVMYRHNTCLITDSYYPIGGGAMDQAIFRCNFIADECSKGGTDTTR